MMKRTMGITGWPEKTKHFINVVNIVIRLTRNKSDHNFLTGRRILIMPFNIYWVAEVVTVNQACKTLVSINAWTTCKNE